MRWLTRYRWHEGVAGRSFSSRPDSAWSASFTRPGRGTLASHGYVVVAIDHPHDANIVEFPDRHVVVPSSQMNITAALSVRVADTRFVLSELARLGRAGFFAGRSRPRSRRDVRALARRSGGRSTMLADPRIDAGADLDGVLFDGARTGGLSRSVHADERGSLGFAADPNRAGFWSRLRGSHYAVDSRVLAISRSVILSSSPLR